MPILPPTQGHGRAATPLARSWARGLALSARGGAAPGSRLHPSSGPAAWHARAVATPAFAEDVLARMAIHGAGVALDDELARALTSALDAGWCATVARFPDAAATVAAGAGAERLGFVDHTAAVLAGAADLGRRLGQLRVDDLYLAWWAGQGGAAGIAAFERTFAPDLDRLLARFHRLPSDDLRQQLRVRLFVGTATTPPRVLAYAGLGHLQNWLRVTASRLFVDTARASRGKDREVDDEPLLMALPAADDPELGQLRAQLHEAIKPALAAAAAALAPRARTFLRHVYVDELTLDQIAALHDVHRATVARTLASARADLWAATRAEVAERLGVGAEQLASVVRYLGSQFDLSLSRVFASVSEGAAGADGRP